MKIWVISMVTCYSEPHKENPHVIPNQRHKTPHVGCFSKQILKTFNLYCRIVNDCIRRKWRWSWSWRWTRRRLRTRRRWWTRRRRRSGFSIVVSSVGAVSSIGAVSPVCCTIGCPICCTISSPIASTIHAAESWIWETWRFLSIHVVHDRFSSWIHDRFTDVSWIYNYGIFIWWATIPCISYIYREIWGCTLRSSWNWNPIWILVIPTHLVILRVVTNF